MICTVLQWHTGTVKQFVVGTHFRLNSVLMKDDKMTVRKNVSMTPEMAGKIEDLAFEHRVRSDSAIVRAAVSVALRHGDELKREINDAKDK